MADRIPLKILSTGRLAQFQSGDTISTTIAPGTGGSGGGTTAAIVMPYIFSTTTTDSDPGAGVLRLDNATQGSATVIRVDDLDDNGIDWQALFLTMADPLSANSYTGFIQLIHQTDPTKWIQFEVTVTIDATGYWNLGVTVVNISGANPFADTDPLFLVYVQNGAKGDAGTTGANGSPSSVPDGRQIKSLVTSSVPAVVVPAVVVGRRVRSAAVAAVAAVVGMQQTPTPHRTSIRLRRSLLEPAGPAGPAWPPRRMETQDRRAPQRRLSPG
jgi:hypothetical protein